jgi:general secretion pathway protein D
MVLDNHTANITVGTQQPVQAGSSVTSTGTTVSSIQYKDTGVNLTVTPSVNAGNMVTMELQQTVSDVGATQDKATGQYPFNQRQITSKVAVRSGENIVLGGLIRDNNSNGSSGLPLLSSIPVIGGLFGAKNSSTNRTELLVVLTPRVVRSDQEIRDVSEEMRDKLKGLSGFKNLNTTPAGKAPLTQSTSTLK